MRRSLTTLCLTAALLGAAPCLAQEGPSPAGPAAPPAGSPDRAARRPPPVDPVSLTYDFEHGIKTTVLADGTIVEEAFDPRAARRLAGKPGGRSVTATR